ncbi:MAG TPA: hypothetical protein VGL65_04320 [Gemmatimonadales bacterium]
MDTATWAPAVARVQEVCGLTGCLAEVAVLRHLGLSEKAVAGALGIPYATCHARFRRLYKEHKVDGVIALVLLVERALNGNPSTPQVTPQ